MTNWIFFEFWIKYFKNHQNVLTTVKTLNKEGWYFETLRVKLLQEFCLFNKIPPGILNFCIIIIHLWTVWHQSFWYSLWIFLCFPGRFPKLLQNKKLTRYKHLTLKMNRNTFLYKASMFQALSYLWLTVVVSITNLVKVILYQSYVTNDSTSRKLKCQSNTIFNFIFWINRNDVFLRLSWYPI